MPDLMNEPDSWKLRKSAPRTWPPGQRSQQSRLRLFRRLITLGDREIPAGQLAEELKLPAATLSFHLKELRSSGLVSDRREGRNILYSLNPASLRDLEDSCNGRQELCQPLLELIAEDDCSSHE